LFPALDDPPAVAPLERAQLREIVAALAADPTPWAHLVRHDPARRVFECLRLDEQVEIWLICWMPGHDTAFTTTTSPQAPWSSRRGP
jgi:cysteine dioxygenase type I